MTMATRTPIEKLHSHSVVLFLVMWPNYSGTVFVGDGVHVQMQKGKLTFTDVPTSVHFLHKTLNLVISRCCFAKNGKEMYQNVYRKCRAIVQLMKTYCFMTFSMSLSSSLLKFPTSGFSRTFCHRHFRRGEEGGPLFPGFFTFR